jgi:hypothetical protein
MMKRVFVVPAPGLYVPDAHGVPFPSEGREVNKSTIINRLIKEGALIVKEPCGPASMPVTAVEEVENSESDTPEWKPVARKKRG